MSKSVKLLSVHAINTTPHRPSRISRLYVTFEIFLASFRPVTPFFTILHTPTFQSARFMQRTRFTESQNLKDVTLYSIQKTQAPPTVCVSVLSTLTLSICMSRRHMEGGEVQFHSHLTSILDEVSQLQAPGAVPPVPTELRAVYAPEPV